MSGHQVYISNHSRALRFPWSLYHRPLIDSLHKFLRSIQNPKDKKILVIGPGDLFEMPLLLSLGFKISLLDIDQRVLDRLKELYPESIEVLYLVDENFQGYPDDESFDVIYAKEVIEHLLDPKTFMIRVKNLLKPEGRVWLSTPNYGFFLLPLLEKSVLELVARYSGFTRKNIHPSKFSLQSLISSIENSGLIVEDAKVSFARLAISISAKKAK